MGNIVLGHRSKTKQFTFVPYVGKWNSAYPQTNLGLLPLSKVARSVSASPLHTRIGAVATEEQVIGQIGLLAHSSSLSGLFRVIAYSDADFTDGLEVFDSGWQCMNPVISAAVDDNWFRPSFFLGTYGPSELAGQVNSRIYWFGQNVACKSLLVLISDPENSAGVFDIGMLEIAEAVQLTRNVSYGAQYGLKITDITTEARGGGVYVNEYPNKRVFKGAIQFTPRTEAKQVLYEMVRQLKSKTGFLFQFNPDDDANSARDAFYARWVEPGLFSYAAHNYDSVPLSFEEVNEQ